MIILYDLSQFQFGLIVKFQFDNLNNDKKHSSNACKSLATTVLIICPLSARGHGNVQRM